MNMKLKTWFKMAVYRIDNRNWSYKNLNRVYAITNEFKSKQTM